MSGKQRTKTRQKRQSQIKTQQGLIPVPGGRVWFERRVADEGTKVPLVVVHGGPGVPHDYLEPLFELARERPVVLYDQLGCGNSDLLKDKTLLDFDRFVGELGELLRFLDLRPAHIFGHSWGAALALQQAIIDPESVASLVLADPFHSGKLWTRDSLILRAQLPRDVRTILARHETAGTIDSEEYEEATMVFYRRHLNRQVPWPEVLKRALDRTSWFVYTTMWGPEEFTLTGTLADFDQTSRMREVRAPTLLVCGQYDEVRPETVDYYSSLIHRSLVQVFQESSHTPHLEQPVEFLGRLSQFLASNDR